MEAKSLMEFPSAAENTISYPMYTDICDKNQEFSATQPLLRQV